MKYRIGYSFTFLSSLPEIVKIPLRYELDNKKFEINEIDEKRQYATGFMEAQIDRQELSLSAEKKSLDGTTTPARIIVPSALDLGPTVSRIVQALSFIADIPICQARLLFQDEIIPETRDDKLYLESLGTNEIYHELSATPSIRTFAVSDLSEDFLDKLMEKETGLALYAQALLQQDDTGKFRELWKVLEAAFGVQKKELIECLIGYESVKQLDFSKEELQSLLALRGRVSHATSRAGIEELRCVNQEVSEKLPRLKCLVEQVLLTKRTWGVRSQYIDRLAQLAAFIGNNGSVIIFQCD